MHVRSLCPIATGGFFWRPRFGGHAYVVVAKATFELLPNVARLAAQQEPLLHGDRHYDDDPAMSVYAPDDMVPFRDRVDVTLVGDAFAPRARRGDKGGSHAVVARLRVGGLDHSVDKKIVVNGQRWLEPNGRVTRGTTFQRMAVRYEHAAGGGLQDRIRQDCR